MRKCMVWVNVNVSRSDDELLKLYEKMLSEKGIVMQPQSGAYSMSYFFEHNRSYCNSVNVPGLFHEWGVDFEEFENGTGNYTIAIVELEDGSIVTRPTDKVVFLPDNHDGFDNFKYKGDVD